MLSYNILSFGVGEKKESINIFKRIFLVIPRMVGPHTEVGNTYLFKGVS